MILVCRCLLKQVGVGVGLGLDFSVRPVLGSVGPHAGRAAHRGEAAQGVGEQERL